jgi:hypothetical protein
MSTANQICPISTRTAYFGARRIAPVAATSRIEARGARPAVEELRPARSFTKPQDVSTLTLPTAAFVTQAIGQCADDETLDAQFITRRYIATDELGGSDPCLHIATL